MLRLQMLSSSVPFVPENHRSGCGSSSESAEFGKFSSHLSHLPLLSSTFPAYHQHQGICHKSSMGRSITASHAGLSD